MRKTTSPPDAPGMPPDDSCPQAPLVGLRVLEMGSLIAGPYAAALLGQFGAEVIKIEPPGAGDPLRGWRKLHNGTSLWWYAQSRNKKSVTLDLSHPRGQEIARELIRGSDILIENFRPGTLEKWGLGWDKASALNPSLVMLRVSGYGQTGPYRDRPGFGAIAESMGGLRYVTGHSDRPPVRVGVSLGDTLASLYGVIGALLALHHIKSNSGTGQLVDVALYESVLGVMESLIPEYSALGHVRERTGSALPGIVPSDTYPCRNGDHVIIAGNGDGIYQRLMNAIGRTDLANDPRLARNEGRVHHVKEIDAAITTFTLARDIDEVLQTLNAVAVPCARVYTAADVHADPHVRAREMLESHALPDGKVVDFLGVVPKLSATPGRTRWLGPELGQHTEEVLASLGITSADLKTLRAEGVV